MLLYRRNMVYWHGLEQCIRKMEPLQKCERGLELSVYPSTEMSVKGFIAKYFKTNGEEKVHPELPVQPIIGGMTRTQVDYYRPVHVVPSFREHEDKDKKSSVFHIFTDGACINNGSKKAKGGIGVHFFSDPALGLDISQPLLASEPQTNNRAELRAIQAALDVWDSNHHDWPKKFTHVQIWSDSEYSIHCLTKWAEGWRRNGWKKKDGTIIQNVDLIKPIYERLLRSPRISLHHVRGHQNNRKDEFPFNGNHKADELATRSIRSSSPPRQGSLF